MLNIKMSKIVWKRVSDEFCFLKEEGLYNKKKKKIWDKKC